MVQKHVTQLLSHRLRGFGPRESSAANLEEALRRGVRIIEVDTRVTHDGIIVVHHAPTLQQGPLRGRLISQLSWEEIETSRRDTSRGAATDLMTLTELAGQIKASGDVELWVDIKDFGAEAEHVHVLEEHELIERSRVISWLPQSVLAVHRARSGVRIGFSYCCTQRKAPLYRLLASLIRLLGREGRALTHLSSTKWWGEAARLVLHTRQGASSLTAPLAPGTERGYNHAHLIAGLPAEPLLSALASDRGAIGMFPGQATHGIVRQAHEAGLEVYVYCIDDDRQLYGYLKDRPVDIVFTNSESLICQVPEVAT